MPVASAVDIGVFVVGLAALCVGVGVKDWPSSLIVLGLVMMGLVVAARFKGAPKK